MANNNDQRIGSSYCPWWKTFFPGYNLFYLDGPPQVLGNVEEKAQIISDYLLREQFLEEQRLQEIEQSEYFELSYENIIKDPQIISKWPSFEHDLLHEPFQVVTLWSATMHKIISEKLANKTEEEEEEEEEYKEDSSTVFFSKYNEEILKKNGNVGMIQAGIMRQTPVTPLRNLTSQNIGTFVTIRGTVIGTSEARPICLQQTFECGSCKSTFILSQPNGIYTKPNKCGAGNVYCKNTKRFEVSYGAATTLMTEYRSIRLQDQHNYDAAVGTVPPTITCELSNGLVSQVNSGDSVTITGIVKIKKQSQFGRDSSLYNFYIHVLAVRRHKDYERSMGGQVFSFSNKDFCAISEIQGTRQLFRLLTASICPSIYGMENVKAGILLAMLGGSQGDSNKNDGLARRGDINVLIVGDPGLGKSQLLRFVSDVSPRGVYVCGSGATNAGLTVSLSKEKDSGGGEEYSLEPGALVMADRGICCIDEFEKMKAQHPVLLEVMEQQSISIAKAGISRILPARTTVIAASNPVGGHYDRRKSITENLGIHDALLSRFDLIFIVLDEPNKDLDQKIVEHIMGKFPTARRQPSNNNNNNHDLHQEQESDTTSSLQQVAATASAAAAVDEQNTNLLDRLKVQSHETLDLIPAQLLQKYIAYARKYVVPKLSTESAAVLKQYYMGLRATNTVTSTPVTTRQLESLLRLSQARAKLELRENVTEQDAHDAVEIFESGLAKVTKNLDLYVVTGLTQAILDGGCEIGSSGSSSIITSQASSGRRGTRGTGPTTKVAQANVLLAELKKCATQLNKRFFKEKEIEEIGNRLSLSTPVTNLITMLNVNGELLKRGASSYYLNTTNK